MKQISFGKRFLIALILMTLSFLSFMVFNSIDKLQDLRDTFIAIKNQETNSILAWNAYVDAYQSTMDSPEKETGLSVSDLHLCGQNTSTDFRICAKINAKRTFYGLPENSFNNLTKNQGEQNEAKKIILETQIELTKQSMIGFKNSEIYFQTRKGKQDALMDLEQNNAKRQLVPKTFPNPMITNIKVVGEFIYAVLAKPFQEPISYLFAALFCISSFVIAFKWCGILYLKNIRFYLKIVAIILFFIVTIFLNYFILFWNILFGYIAVFSVILFLVFISYFFKTI